MPLVEIPHIALPVTVTCKSGERVTEDFSVIHAKQLPDTLLRELGFAISLTDHASISTVRHAVRSIRCFCDYLVEISPIHPISSLNSFTQELMHLFVGYLQHRFPSAMKGSKPSHPWYSIFKNLRARLTSLSDSSDFYLYVEKPDFTPIEGHTPHAMGMMLNALRDEIDRIRAKIGKWDEALINGNIVDINKHVAVRKGRVCAFTEKELDEFETLVWGSSAGYGPTNDRLYEKYGIHHLTARNCLKKLENDENLPRRVTSRLSEKQLTELKSDLSLPRPLSSTDIAERMGSTLGKVRYTIKRWEREGRPEGRDSNDVDITVNDVIATIRHYLPGWPVTGHISQQRPYRVYKSERGIFHSDHETRAEADNIAEEIGGHVVSGLKHHKFDKRLNPGEMLLTYRTSEANTYIRQQLVKAIPNGKQGLLNDYLATTYDMICVFLYWHCLTGWNREASRSVTILQLRRLIEGKGTLDLLSKGHSTLEVTIEPDIQDDVLVPISGDKKRSQPEGKPMVFTHISDNGDEYGLVNVLKDFHALSKPLRVHLQREQTNSILIGISFNKGIATHSEIQFDGWQIKSFFEQNEIYEDIEKTRRITTTDTRKLRSTYFSTLQYLGVPITTQMFLGRHTSMDTTLSYYGENSVSIAIKETSAREKLNELELKIFSGTLQRYSKNIGSKPGSSVIQIFTHRENDISLCLNRFNPTWHDNEKYLQRSADGRLHKACDFFHMCLMCKQCVISENTLPYLFKWQSDIREWKRKAGFTDFPVFMGQRFQAIGEIFKLCEASGEYWQRALTIAEHVAMDQTFSAPPIWRSI